MRLFLSILVTALIAPLAAYATPPPKQVEVINDPLLVEVVSPAPPGPPAHWQLVGFTSATYDGDMGGYLGVTRKCQVQFPNSRMCTVLEVQNTTTIPEGLVGPAFVNAGFETVGGHTAGADGPNCRHWLDTVLGASTFIATTVRATGESGRRDCDIPHSIACCALVP